MSKPDSRPLLASAKGRTKSLVIKLRQAMKAIEVDIEANEGVYPFNKGRVTQAEVCRRAGTRPAVLQGPNHKATTLVEVNQWVASIQKKLIAGHASVRKTVTQRADNWKQLYTAAAHQSNLYHVQMVTLRNQLQASQQKIAELEAENLRLQEAISEGRVVRMPSNKKR